MIVGQVAQDEPLVTLSVEGYQGSVSLRAVIDTGFSGFLALPQSTIQQCGFNQIDIQNVVLADGSARRVTVYEAIVTWDDDLRTVPAYGVSGGALVGMKMLRGNILTIEVEAGGEVTIETI